MTNGFITDFIIAAIAVFYLERPKRLQTHPVLLTKGDEILIKSGKDYEDYK